MIIDEEVYLEHFGVKGMHWGVRKSPEKLKEQAAKTKEKEAKTKAKFEAKAQKHDAEAKQYQNAIDKIDAITPRSKFHAKSLKEQRFALEQQKKVAEKAAKDKREGKLTDRQKKIAKGALIAGGVLAAYGAYTLVQTGEANRMLMRGRAVLSGKGAANATWAKNAALARKDMTPDEIMASVVKQVNPGYRGGLGPGSRVNCRRCTFAYEMRRRGYDVAATRTTNSRGQDVSGMYNALVLQPGHDRAMSGRSGIIAELITDATGKKPNPVKFTDAIQDESKLFHKTIKMTPGQRSGSSIFSALRGQPNGARGEVDMQWLMGGGHSMAYEIVGGKPVIFDTQTGKKYDGVSFSKEFGQKIRSAGFTRLDDVKLNEDFLMRWVKNA